MSSDLNSRSASDARHPAHPLSLCFDSSEMPIKYVSVFLLDTRLKYRLVLFTKHLNNSLQWEMFFSGFVVHYKLQPEDNCQ